MAITGFAAGSIIVNFDIIFPADSDITSETVKAAILNIGFVDGFSTDPTGTQLTGKQRTINNLQFRGEGGELKNLC